MKGYKVLPISYSDTKPFILHIHYAKRLPSITHSFGLFKESELVGIVTYGSPPSQALCRGIAGDAYKNIVLELNRLVLKNNIKNEASYLVANSFKFLKKPLIIVSFADINQNHNGYIYQATNFFYTGLSTNDTQYQDKNGNEFHFRKLGHYKKNNTLNVPLIKKRIDEKNINKIEIANFLRKFKGNYTANQLDKIFGYKCRASHWFRKDKGFSFPTIDDWNKLKTILKFDNTYDYVMQKYELVADIKEIKKTLNLKKILIKKKHRYIYLLANKKDKKNLLKKLNYPILDYPKFQNKNYKTDTNITTQGLLI